MTGGFTLSIAIGILSYAVICLLALSIIMEFLWLTLKVLQDK